MRKCVGFDITPKDDMLNLSNHKGSFNAIPLLRVYFMSNKL